MSVSIMDQVWLNGKLLPAQQATIRIDDHAFVRGWGVFETMLGVDGQVPLWSRHWQRLRSSVTALAMPQLDQAFVEAGLDALLNVRPDNQKPDNQKPDTDLPRFQRLRLTVSAGAASTGRGGGWWAKHQDLPTILITASPLPADSFDAAKAAIRLMVSPYPIHSGAITSGHKTTSYISNIMTRQTANRAGYDDALILNQFDHVVETSSANIFFIEDDRLVTPPVSSGCLPGIMRQLVIEAATQLGIDVLQVPVHVQNLGNVSAAFVTSATSITTTVVAMDDRDLNPPVASWMKALQQRLRHLTRVESEEMGSARYRIDD